MTDYRTQDPTELRRDIDDLRAKLSRAREELTAAKRKKLFGTIDDIFGCTAMAGMVTFALIGGYALFVSDSDRDSCAYDCATTGARCVQDTDRGSVCKLNGRYFTVPNGDDQ